MEKNCVHMMYRTSLTTMNTTMLSEEEGANPTTAKTKKNKLSKVGEEDFANGISWPSKSYGCSFCQREFKSAQALGGHMNVHRRDRALLYSTQLADGHLTNLNLNLNPNPNHNLPSHCYLDAFGRPLARKASDLSSSSTVEIAKANVFERAHWNKGEKVIELDTEIISNNINTNTSAVVNDSKNDIDLELRLGYST